MHRKKIKFWLPITALLILLVMTAVAQDARLKETGARADIVGTWLVNLNINGGASPTSSPTAQQPDSARTQAPFIAVETFHADGTFIETSLIDYIPPQGPPGQGVWERRGSREFALTIYGVTVGDLTNPQLQGTYKVRSKLTLSHAGDEFSGPFTIEIFDPAGDLVTTLEGTAQGRRARVEPLP
ncbi:MAG: hypothetical protein M3362_07545 [Acidobacteriota bacterium]|nr:hypothetical protein [Acidobacteriota bacterium]